MSDRIPSYCVWCGGAEVVDSYVTLDRANTLFEEFVEDGYDDVVITKGFHEKSEVIRTTHTAK